MKHFHFWITSLILLLLLFLLGSCSCIKKIKRTTEIRTIKIDTVLTINLDLKAKIKKVPVFDTARLENQTASAVSYIDPITGKIVLTLTGKTFDVPFTMNQIIETKSKEKTFDPKPKRINRLLWFCLGGIIGFFIAIKLPLKT